MIAALSFIARGGAGLAGDGCSVVENVPDIGHGNVGCATRVCRRNEALFDPSADGVLAHFIAIGCQVAVDLSDGSSLKCVITHGISSKCQIILQH